MALAAEGVHVTLDSARRPEALAKTRRRNTQGQFPVSR